METRELTGNVDAVLQMKSQLDYMTGRNDELRAELRHLTLDAQKAHVELHNTRLNVRYPAAFTISSLTPRHFRQAG